MDPLILLSLLVAGIPLVTFVLIILNQKPLAERAHLIALPGIAFSTALAFYVAWARLHDAAAPPITWSADWIRFGTVPGMGAISIPVSVQLDNITAILLVLVAGISALVHLYSVPYMRGDVRYARYFAFLALFTSAMLGIVLAGNLLQLYVFWELVGFSSYALIAHWYEQRGPQRASKKAFIVNRVGDVMMWIGILLLFREFHTFDFREIFAHIDSGLPISFRLFGFSPEATLTAAGLLLFGGAVAKSAQFPLHIWLPDAMEGPTPVSALIHAATMVAAGVYLLARIFPMLTSKAMLAIACAGAFTSVLAATIAITQRDIKKVLAYSTISQLALMIMSIGSGAVAAGVFHLVAHAAFKACLFLAAGSVIKAMHRAMDAIGDHETNDHDIFSMGGLFRKMPVTGWTFLIATLAISGLPLTAGFLSKDEILAGAMAYGDLQKGIAQAIPWVGFGVTMLTALYMWREFFLVFLGTPAKPALHEKIRESPKLMIVPQLILAVASLWFWYAKSPIDASDGRFLHAWVQTPSQIVPPQSAPPFRPLHYTAPATVIDTLGVPAVAVSLPVLSSIPPMPHQVALQERHDADASLAEIAALASGVTGFLIALLLFQLRPAWSCGLKRGLYPLYAFSFRGWFLDDIYQDGVVPFVAFIAATTCQFDQNVLDRAVNFAGRMTVVLARITGAFDKYVVDGVVTLVGATTQFFGLMARSIQTGRIQTYLTWVVAAIVATIVILRFALLHS